MLTRYSEPDLAQDTCRNELRFVLSEAIRIVAICFQVDYAAEYRAGDCLPYFASTDGTGAYQGVGI